MACVGIVVPVYNVPELYLRKCIESIIAQKLIDIEIILVDDGSTDNSPKICDEYAKIDNRVKVVHQQNKGLSGARNTGVNISKSKWITFVDGDDWIESDCLLSAYENAEKNDLDIVLWGTVKDFNGILEPFDYTKNFIDGKIYVDDEVSHIRELLLHFNAQIATAYAKLIKKSVLINNEIFHNEELRQGAEGLEFNYRLFAFVSKLMFINKHWYHYIYNENSISSISSEANTEYVVRCFEKIRSSILESDTRTIGWFYNRFSYVIVTTAISGYFHPKNNLKYKLRKQKMSSFLKKKIVVDTFHFMHKADLSFQRRMILILLRFRLFFAIKFIANLRYKQKCDKNRLLRKR